VEGAPFFAPPERPRGLYAGGLETQDPTFFYNIEDAVDGGEVCVLDGHSGHLQEEILCNTFLAVDDHAACILAQRRNHHMRPEGLQDQCRSERTSPLMTIAARVMCEHFSHGIVEAQAISQETSWCQRASSPPPRFTTRQVPATA